MSGPSRLLPALVALALIGTLGTAGVTAGDLRADERRAETERRRVAAAEAEARAVDGYRTAVAALSEEIYDLVQPLQSAVERVAAAEDGSFTVLSDVSTRGGAADGLTALRERLDAVAVPQSVSDGHDELDAALDALLRGTRRLGDAVAPDLADREFSSMLVEADEALDVGTRTWNRRLAELFGSGGAPSTVTESGLAGAARPPASKPAYLEAVGGLCAPTPADEGEDTAAIRRSAATLRTLLDALRAVEAPRADAETVRATIGEHLERAADAPQGFDAAAAAIDARDERALSAADIQVERGLLSMQRAAEGFDAYGSRTCRLALQTEDDPDADSELTT